MQRTQRLLLVAISYVVAHALGYYFVSRAHWVSPVWPASGVGLAALLLTPRSAWRSTIAVLGAATLFSNLILSGSLAMSIGFTASNLLEFWVGALLVVRRREAPSSSRRTAEVLRLALVATLWTAVPAVIGAATGSIGRGVPFGRNYLTWWIADALGILLVTPLIVSWARRGHGLRTARSWEAALLTAAWGLTAWVACSAELAGPLVPHPYMLLPLLAWTALRLNERVVTLVLVAIAALAIVNTLNGSSALGWGLAAGIDPLITTQVYVAVAAVQSLLLCAGTSDAQELERAAREDEARVRRAEAETRSHAESLSASEARFRTLIENTSDLITVLNRDGVIRFQSPSSSRMLGLTPEEVVGTSVIQLTHPDDLPLVYEALAAVHNPEPITVKLRLRHRDGSYRLLECVGRSVPDEAEDGYTVVNSRDITESSSLQEQLRRTQKLEALGTLAGGIAHDFNNILGAMLAFTELARLENPDRLPLQEQLREITLAGKRATNLVSQILSFSRQQRQERKPISLTPVVQEALKLLRSTLPSTIELVASLPGTLPSVSADATQMHQVVMNLCTNAAQAMGGRGRLTVSVDTFEQEAHSLPLPIGFARGPHVRLSVADTGHGMAATVVERIFEPFFTTKAPGEGTGLGLAVVHGIVKDHDGIVSVQSEPGKGTTFAILLPVVATVEAPAERLASEAPRGRGQKVLFVDDERALCEAARLILMRAGYDAVAHRDSSEAWHDLEDDPDGYALVVTDLTMPGMTGLDLAEKIHGLRPELPIILTSGHPGELGSETLEQLGVRELLHKPIDYAVLTQAVARVIPATRRRELAKASA